MKTRSNSLLHWLVAATFSVFSAASLAIPKAAEHEDAQVTTGADVARPKRSAIPAKPPVSVKARPAAKGKPVKTAKYPKKAKAVQGKK